ncbi:MAG: 50S ribosomal protein L21 [Caldithrix sp.]|nr:50S ribosomal protein L21 [Caldithrix sp.]
MYAIVEIGGKQYKVEQNQKLRVPLLDTQNKKTVKFDKVLFFEDDKGKPQIGNPVVKNMQVSATVVENGKDKKITVFKKKRRKGYRVKKGHRQPYTLIQIDNIGKVKAAPKKDKAADESTNAKSATVKKDTQTKTKAKAESKPKAAPKKTKKEEKES